jgi:hypothetical protein
VRYRASLEAARAAADVLHAVPFERTVFPDGDIVADFAARLLPEAGDALRAVDDPKVRPSMSAEAMAIVQDFRRERYPAMNDRFTRDTGALVKHLAAEEAALGGQRRPVLKPEVRDLVDRASVDLLWLRDTLGVRFADIDYDAIGPADTLTAKTVAEICHVDIERKAALEATLARLDLPTGETERKTFRAGVSRAGKTERSGQDDKPAGRRGLFGWR